MLADKEPKTTLKLHMLFMDDAYVYVYILNFLSIYAYIYIYIYIYKHMYMVMFIYILSICIIELLVGCPAQLKNKIKNYHI